MKDNFFLKTRELLKKMKFIYLPYKRLKIGFISKYRHHKLHTTGYVILNELTSIFEKTDYVFFAACGTMLGIVRDGAFISHDDDMDFGVVYSESFSWQEFESILNEHGYKKDHEYSFDGQITEMCFRKYNTLFDVFLFLENENKQNYSYGYYFNEKNGTYTCLKCKCPIIEKCIKVDVGGKAHALIPANHIEYIVANYGDTWRTPDLDFHRELLPMVETIENAPAKRVDY